VLLPLVPEFTTSAFLNYSCCTFKIFLVEVVAIGRKNAGRESDKYKIHYLEMLMVPFAQIKCKLQREW
jgi:hypothetical protein